MPPRLLLLRWFARTYGWTPQEVRGLAAEEAFWFPVIEDAAAGAQRIQQERARK